MHLANICPHANQEYNPEWHPSSPTFTLLQLIHLLLQQILSLPLQFLFLLLQILCHLQVAISSSLKFRYQCALCSGNFRSAEGIIDKNVYNMRKTVYICIPLDHL
jgi:hypothetical protein